MTTGIRNLGRPPANLTETFAAPSTDEVYTQSDVGAGNSLNPDFDNATMGGPCAAVSIGATNGDAFWAKKSNIPSRTGYRTSTKFLLATNGLDFEGAGITLAIAKPEGDLGGNVACWRLYFWKTGANTHFLLAMGNDEVVLTYPTQPAGGSISIGVAYTHEVVYDIRNKLYSWSVNGTPIASAAMPATFPQSVQWKVVGSSGSSSGRNSVFLVGNVAWAELYAIRRIRMVGR